MKRQAGRGCTCEPEICSHNEPGDTPKGANTMTTTSKTSSLATPTKSYRLLWSPTAQVIATVQATTKRAAIRKAPQPYRRYLGEIYAEKM